MKMTRRFLLAPSLARLVRKERGSARVTEGFFPTQSGRNTHVHLEGGQCHLVLVTAGAGEAATEERTEVPRAHADALLDVCPGKIVYERARIAVGGREVFVDRFSSPSPFDIVVAEFDDEAQAEAFQPPAWFDAEVTRDSGYDNRLIGLQGPPATSEVQVTNSGLEALLDTIENRVGMPAGQRAAQVAAAAPAPARRSNDDVMDALRRLAASSPAAAIPVVQNPVASAPAAVSPLAASQTPAPEAKPSDEASEPAHEPNEVTSEYESEVQMPVAGASNADSRLDDVIAGLSQVLGTPGDRPEPKTSSFPAMENVRFGGRLRRSEG